MNTIQILRKKTDLPHNYRVKLPISERKAILKNALLECRLRNALLLKKNKAKCEKEDSSRKSYLAKSNRLKIVKSIAESNPSTSIEVVWSTSIEMLIVGTQIGQLVKMGYLSKTGFKREVNGRLYLLYQITQKGINYVEENDHV